MKGLLPPTIGNALSTSVGDGSLTIWVNFLKEKAGGGQFKEFENYFVVFENFEAVDQPQFYFEPFK